MNWNPIQWLSRKESAVGRLISSFNVGRAVFPDRNFHTYSKEAYQLNVIAYRCVELISTNAAKVPWLVYRDEDEVTDHPLITLLKRPNPMQSGKELFTAVYAYELLTGNSYLERVLVDGNARVKELYALRPDRMKIVPGRFGLPQQFDYTVNALKQPFKVDPVTGVSDVLHVKRFNPLNDWYGQSPLEAMGMSVDSHNEATRWNYALLKNGARPSGAMEYEGDLDDANFQRVKAEVDESYSGGKRGRPMLLQGGLKWVQMMLSQMDMDWAKGRERNAAEIAVGYSVPEQLVGVPGQQTYNNYREARMALYEEAVLPLLDRYAEAMTNWMQSIGEFQGLRLGYDIDMIDALALRREALWEKVRSADFLKVDEKRAALGYEPYEPDETPGGMILVGASLMPLSAVSMDLGDETPVGEEGEPQLDAEGKPMPTGGGPVQDLALNGAQIQAVVQIVQAVVDEQLPPESATQLLRVAFPSIDEATASSLIKPAAAFTPKPKEPVMVPGQEPPNDKEDEEDEDAAKKKLEKHVVRCLELKRMRDVRKRTDRAYELAYGRKR
jgi:HK97 family phage portal protein